MSNSDLSILSEAELDAVCGGVAVDISGGLLNGGNGGTAANGAAISASGRADFSNADLSVSRSSATANGGNGGIVRIRLG
jgi:hypothetical protein